MKRTLLLRAGVCGLALSAVALWTTARTQAPDRHADSVPAQRDGGEERTARGERAADASSARGRAPSGLEVARGSATVVDRIAGIRELGERKDLAALPWLERSVLSDQPEIAPTLITTVADLAAAAQEDDRDRAARTLGEWLQTEAEREGADARGNVAVLVEALAKTGSPAAVDALSLALDQQRFPLHIEVRAVLGLLQLDDPRALGAVERFGRRIEALPRASGFDEELRQEAVLTARATLASLRS